MTKYFFVTSSFPYGIGESFLFNEYDFMSQKFDVTLIPIHQKVGVHKNRRPNSKLYVFPNKAKLIFIFIFISFFKPHLFLHCYNRNLYYFLKNISIIPKVLKFYLDYKDSTESLVFYVHWFSLSCMFVSLLKVLMPNIKIVVTGHRWDLVENNNLDFKFEKANVIRLISKKSLKLLDDNLVNKFKDKIIVKYMGVNVPKLHKKTKNNVDIFSGVCVANLISIKGHVYLIEALSQLKNKGYIFKFDFVGCGVLKSSLQNKIDQLGLSDCVKFLGVVSNEKLLELYKSNYYDFFCLPSVDLGNGLHEGVPVSLMEAMAHLIPVISTNTGSIPELIIDKYNGLLVSDKSVVELVDAIENILLNKSLRITLSKNAYNYILKNFDESTICMEMASIVSKI